MKKTLVLTASLTLCLAMSTGLVLAQRDNRPPETLLPAAVIDALINEVSGDVALQNEILLTAVNRNRLPEEYVKGYYECDYILKKLQEYGITDSRVIDLPTRAQTTWDAEMGELWLVEPELRKIADLREIAASLCSGSASTDTTAELVYVGLGNTETYYQGKDVKGKILLTSGSAEMVRRIGVEKHEALGVVSFTSTHPEFDRDEVQFGSIRPGDKDKPAFGFMLSSRRGSELREMLERGFKVKVRAVCMTQQVPYKEQMVEAVIKGAEMPAEELIFSGHLFEGFAKQGSNDDASGCVAILETARTLRALVDQGKIPPLKRSVRFIFVPEISGTIAYVAKYPEIAERFFASINEDMVGEGLIKNNAYFVMKRTPHALASCLNDVVQALIEWIGETQKQTIEHGDMRKPIVSPTGTRDPFYYSIDEYFGGSDHLVFNDSGVQVPSVMLNIWPDMWYHTSGDTPDKSDSTQLKRAAFLGAAAAVFLANAGSAEAEKMLGETMALGERRLAAEERWAAAMIIGAKPEKLHEAYKEALNVINQSIKREGETLASIGYFIRGDEALKAHAAAAHKNLESLKPGLIGQLDEAYRFACLKAKVKPRKPMLSKDEVRLAGVVPVRTPKMKGFFSSSDFYEKAKDIKGGVPTFTSSMAEGEVRNFIDGKRSILDIRNAVSAEFEPVPLESVERLINALKTTGFVEFKKK